MFVTFHGSEILAAVELLERLLEGDQDTLATNVVQQVKFSDLLANVIQRHQNRT